MWAQLIKVHAKPGADVLSLFAQLRAIERPGSGLLRTMVMRDEEDPNAYYTLVVFESAEQARAREQDPGRMDALRPIQEAMAGMLDGPREFVNLAVIEDTATG
ncbi:MAG TPA: antibiotic biosynthesis monooxygenase [Actinomycetes bacterium]|nr:antibiotic biosynthesis monooxygenase [Actinomycetes bacterium]